MEHSHSFEVRQCREHNTTHSSSARVRFLTLGAQIAEAEQLVGSKQGTVRAESAESGIYVGLHLAPSTLFKSAAA